MLDANRSRRTPIVGVAAGLLLAGCALSHDRAGDDPPDAAVGGADAGAARECLDARADLGEVTEEQAHAILARLHHEMTHAAESLAGWRGSSGPWRDERRGDDERLRIAGDVELGDERLRATAVLDFEAFTGMHGGWGLSALDGRACAELVLERREPGGDYVPVEVRVEATLGLAGEEPLMPAPTTFVQYVERFDDGAARLDATVGGHVVVR